MTAPRASHCDDGDAPRCPPLRSPPPRCLPPHCVWWVAALALAIRLGWGLSQLAALDADPDSYRQFAQNVVEYGVLGHGTTASAYRPPLYPGLLVPCVALGSAADLAIALVQAALGVATVWLTARLASAWGQPRAAPLAALLVAIDPLLLHQQTLVMTETLAAALAACSLCMLTRQDRSASPRGGAAAGAVLGMAALCRPTFLPLALLAPLILWRNRAGLREPESTSVGGSGARSAVAYTAALLAVLAPWALRNAVALGRPVVGTTHGGYTLLLGNNTWFYAHLGEAHWGSVWDAAPLVAELQDKWQAAGADDELSRNQIAYRLAWETIGEQPAMFALAAVDRVGRLWRPWPHPRAAAESTAERAARYAVGAWYLAQYALAAMGAVAVGRGLWGTGWRWGLLLALSFTGVHLLYWADMRMRAPLVPLIAILAAVGAASLASAAARRKARPS